jgi:hypothetical protein
MHEKSYQQKSDEKLDDRLLLLGAKVFNLLYNFFWVSILACLQQIRN